MAEVTEIDPELQMLINNESDGYNYQERRHDDWFENYTLSRDKVIINRLTQRQSVNLPLMKTVLKTLLKDVDDMPNIYFENIDNDKQAEVFKNEYWRVTGEINKFEIQDIVDKRQVFHFGRSFDQWQIIDGKVYMSIEDPQDILLSRFTDPTNIHSSRFLIHTHIFKPLSSLKRNPDYDQEKVKEIEEWAKSQNGEIKAEDNYNSLVEKNRKLAKMGVSDIDDPVLGETYVELKLHFVFRDNERNDKGELLPEQIFLYVVAENMQILMKKPLEEIIGTTKDHWWRSHYPYNSWADDVEKQDVWSDGIADTIRTPNKVLNSWFSQMVENRTLRNLNMNMYDSTVAPDDFSPNTYVPKAWGWYGVPGDPNKIVKQMEVADLSDSLDEINFLVMMVEKASGATATQQGVQNERQITLGEIQLALGEAKERIKGMSKFYTQVWKERGQTFIKLLEAGHDKIDAVEVHKKGRNTDRIYSREISPTDWMTPLGYQCRVWDQAEKKEKDMQSLEKINAVSTMIPGNPKLEEIKQRKMLEFAELTPEEQNDVMEVENRKREMQVAAMEQGLLPQPGLDPTQQPGAQPAQIPAAMPTQPVV